MPDSVPEFGQLVEYVTEGPVIHAVALEQHDLANPLSLAALDEDYEYAATLGRPAALDAGALAAVQNATAAFYHDDVVTNEVVATEPRQIVARLRFVRTHPDWTRGMTVVADDVVFHAGNLYRAVQAHTVSDPAWTPDVARALWAHYYSSDEVPAWVAPTGAHDAWPLGARVLHEGAVWQSLIAANVWEPGGAGTEALWANLSTPTTPEWKTGVAYKIGDEAVHQGSVYRCRQAHTSQAGWEPGPATAALWLLL